MIDTSIAVNDLSGRLDQLFSDRMKHVEALNQIDQTLSSINSLLGGTSVVRANGTTSGKSPKLPGPSAWKKRRGPGTYAITAAEAVMAFIASRRQAATAEVNAHRKEAGRNGKPDNTLTLLVKEGKLKRRPIESGRGSTYSLA